MDIFYPLESICPAKLNILYPLSVSALLKTLFFFRSQKTFQLFIMFFQLVIHLIHLQNNFGTRLADIKNKTMREQ
jgi:hypothetical protein